MGKTTWVLLAQAFWTRDTEALSQSNLKILWRFFFCFFLKSILGSITCIALLLCGMNLLTISFHRIILGGIVFRSLSLLAEVMRSWGWHSGRRDAFIERGRRSATCSKESHVCTWGWLISPRTWPWWHLDLSAQCTRYNEIQCMRSKSTGYYHSIIITT